MENSCGLFASVVPIGRVSLTRSKNSCLIERFFFGALLAATSAASLFLIKVLPDGCHKYIGSQAAADSGFVCRRFAYVLSFCL